MAHRPAVSFHPRSSEDERRSTNDRRRRLLARLDALPAARDRRRSIPPRPLPHVDPDAVADAIDRLRPTD